jgi:putative transposase
MIDRGHELPIARQARALNLSRGSAAYLPRPVPAADLLLMRRMDELLLEFPFAGSRMLRDLLNGEGIMVGRRHVVTLMNRMARQRVRRAALAIGQIRRGVPPRLRHSRRRPRLTRPLLRLLQFQTAALQP